MTTWSTPRYVLFDLDGTLVDSSGGILRCFGLTLNTLGYSATPERLRALIGPPLWDSFASLGIPAEQVHEAVDIYRAHYADVGVRDAVPYDGIPELLRNLRDRGVTLGVATAKREDFAAIMLEHLGLAPYFEVTTGAVVENRHMTKFAIMANALERLGRPAMDDVWMVGDRKFDMEGANEHGCRAIGVTWGFGDATELTEHGATLVVHAPHEIAAAFR